MSRSGLLLGRRVAVPHLATRWAAHSAHDYRSLREADPEQVREVGLTVLALLRERDPRARVQALHSATGTRDGF